MDFILTFKTSSDCESSRPKVTIFNRDTIAGRVPLYIHIHLQRLLFSYKNMRVIIYQRFPEKGIKP